MYIIIRVKLSQRYIAHELLTADGQIFGPAAAGPAGPVPTPLHEILVRRSPGLPDLFLRPWPCNSTDSTSVVVL